MKSNLHSEALLFFDFRFFPRFLIRRNNGSSSELEEHDEIGDEEMGLLDGSGDGESVLMDLDAVLVESGASSGGLGVGVLPKCVFVANSISRPQTLRRSSSATSV